MTVPKAPADVVAKVLRHVRGAFSEGGVDRIEIRHLHAGGDEARASVLAGDKIAGKGITPEQIGDSILDDILQDAEMFPGVCNYAVLFYKPGEREYSRRCAVRISGRADRVSNAIETSEPATEKGFVAMAMRTMETMMNRMNQLHEITLRHIAGEHQRLASENQKMSETHLAVLQVGQDLLDKKEERNLKIRREEKQDKIVEKGIEQIMMLGGPLLSKLLPGATGQAVSSDLMIISLLSSLSPEQIQTMMQVMTPEQRVNFVEVYQSLSKRYEKVKIESSKPQTPPESTDNH